MGRPSRVHIRVDSGEDGITAVRVGGGAVVVGDGTCKSRTDARSRRVEVLDMRKCMQRKTYDASAPPSVRILYAFGPRVKRPNSRNLL